MYKKIRVNIYKSLLIFLTLVNAALPGFSILTNKSNDKVIAPLEVEAAIDETEDEFMVDIGPISGTTGTNYAYASLFNPSSSGKTLLVRKITVKAQASASAGFDRMNIKRTSAASGGTLISSSDIPKKNSASANTVAEVRHTIGTSGVTFVGSDDSRILGFVAPANVGHTYGIRYQDFTDTQEPLVLKEGEGIALSQEENSDPDTKFRMLVEWEEVDSVPTTQNTYVIAYPRITVAASAGYNYTTFFNPSSSGKTAIVNKIWFGTETCDAAAVYTNNISIKRISSATGGTQITASNIPKKHTSSSDSVVEIRHTGVTATEVGGADARLVTVTPCGTTTQAQGYMNVVINQNDEKLILQEGEGFTVVSEAAGDIDQHVRTYVEWQEVDTGSTPSSQGEYMFAYPMVSGVAAAANTTFFTLFNPSGSGKTAVIKKLGIRNDADATASSIAFSYRRISAASSGVSITTSDVPEKHTGSSTTVMELRHCGSACGTAISATYSGTSDSRLLTVNGASQQAQIVGHLEYSFGANEKIVLQEGEGIGFYNEATSNANHFIKIYLEWDEEGSSPSSQGEYMINMGPINGSTSSDYVYASILNPTSSGKVVVIKGLVVRIDNNGTASEVSMSVRRLTSTSGGTQIAIGDIPKKHSSTSDTITSIRVSGPTPTWDDGVDSRMLHFVTNTQVTTSTNLPSAHGNYTFSDDDPIILREGEGIGLYQESAGDTDFRVKLVIEWDEENSAPTVDGDYIVTTPPVTGNTSNGYVYSSLFNPSDSGKYFVLKRLEARVNRTAGTPVATVYEPFVIRRTTASSSGTLMTSSDIPKKDTNLATSTAEIRTANPTITYAGSSDSKLLSIMAPGVVNGIGDFYANSSHDDELILAPGEGIAIYQDAAPGDALRIVTITTQWYEVDASSPVISLSVSDGIITYGFVGLGTNRSTIDLTDTQTVTNDGEAAIDVNIRGQNTACPWTLSGSSGTDNYVHSFSVNAGSDWTALTTSYQSMFNSLAVSGNDDFDLRITPPNSTSCYTEQSVDVTVQAVAD